MDPPSTTDASALTHRSSATYTKSASSSIAKHRRTFGCSSDEINVASSRRASSWNCASRRLTATGRPSSSPSNTIVPQEP